MLRVVDERKMLRLWVEGDAKGAVDAIAKREDMTVQGVASRVYQWFGLQDLLVQKWILGQIPKSLEPAASEEIIAAFKKRFKRPPEDRG
jgi:hypothetical protein